MLLLPAAASAGWQRFPEASLDVQEIAEDSTGNYWFRSPGLVTRYDGVVWRDYNMGYDAYPFASMTDLLVDHAGVVWVTWTRFQTGTWLSRFDGSGWQADSIPIASNAGAATMLEDHLGRIWLATQDGVVRFDGTWVNYRVADGLASDHVNLEFEDASHALWFATDAGLSRFDGTTWRTFTVADGLSDNVVTKLGQDAEGMLWALHDARILDRFDGTAWTTPQVAPADASILTFHLDPHGALWTYWITDGPGPGGLARHDAAGWQVFPRFEGSVDRCLGLGLLYGDRAGHIWVGGNGRSGNCLPEEDHLSRFDGRAWRMFHLGDGLPSPFIATAYEDRDGNMWFATFSGLARYDGVSWTSWVESGPFPFYSTNRMIGDSKGGIWAWTGGGTYSLAHFAANRWQFYTTADGLPSEQVNDVLEDRSGKLWVATPQGLARHDSVWTTLTTADGLAENEATALLEDRAGRLWVGHRHGVSLFDGAQWRVFAPGNGLVDGPVFRLIEDAARNIWAGVGYFALPPARVSRYDGTAWFDTRCDSALQGAPLNTMIVDHTGMLWIGSSGRGAGRFDGTSWQTYDSNDGVIENQVSAILEDGDGALWFAHNDGVSRLRSGQWSRFSDFQGGGDVFTLAQDTHGQLWAGASGGLARFNGERWLSYRTSEGLVHDNVFSLFPHASGDLWIGTRHGITRHSPDFVPPRAAFVVRPTKLSASRSMTAGFVAAFNEGGAEFSYSLDHGPWSPWSAVGSWTGENLADGSHVLEIGVRDAARNTRVPSATATFEIDAVPPAPILATPSFGQALHDSILVRGTAADARFRNYQLEMRAAGSSTWTMLRASSAPVLEGVLGGWNTRKYGDGDYALRLSVADTLGLSASAQITAIVDNEPPFLEQTSPARVNTASGGHVYTTHAEAHLYLPPYGLNQDAVVTLAVLDSGVVPPALPDGAIRVLPGYELSWAQANLAKTATFDVAVDGVADALPGPLTFYRLAEGGAWARVGGSLEAGRLAAPIDAPGRYAVFAGAAVGGSGGLGPVSLSPRVFSPRGNYAISEIAISFTLGGPGTGTVRIYNRAGRLVREVASSQTFGAGANLVRWDGRNRDGAVVVDGIYLVTVEALGETRSTTLAVVK